MHWNCRGRSNSIFGEITPKPEEALNLVQVQNHSDVYDTAQ